MGNSVMPSTKLLPMEDIAEVLKEEFGFSSKDDVANDTKKVGGIDAGLTAVAATDDSGNLVADRETVSNALKLGGVEASGYMTRADGSRIETFGDNVSKVFAQELAMLRDELYQMRGELTRNGLINEYGIYSGFQDFFKSGDKKYKMDSLGGLAQNSTSSINVNVIYPEHAEAFKAGDWFVIYKVAQDTSFLVRAVSVDHGELTFERMGSASGIPSTGLEVGNVELYKVLGEYNKGSFSFSKVVENALTNKERYTMLNDDSLPQMQSITSSKSGFASGFRVPASVGGALKEFRVMARSSGSPGMLTCYVMEETDANLLALKSLDNETVGGLLVAKSQPVSASKAALPSPTEITFDFQSTVDGSYPILTGSKRYVFVIVAEQANNGGDKWEIQFSKSAYSNSNADVQTNNRTFTYGDGGGLVETASLGDLIFTLATIEVKSNDESPLDEGLYTSEDIALASPVEVSRARLVLRVNREGNFVSEDSGIVPNGSTFSVINDPNAANGSLPNDIGIRSGDTIAIGTDFRTVTTDCKSMQLTIDKGVYVGNQVPVYRIGYRAFIRAYKKVWNAVTTAFEISNEQLIEMPLVAIMPDRVRMQANQSDRLVFECDFRDVSDAPLDVNMFELQVVWSSHISKDYMVSNSELVGRIHDLTLSFDKTL